MLRTLRLFLSDGTEQLVTETVEREDETPAQLLRRISNDGEVALGDGYSIPLDMIERVALEPPAQARTGPGWGPGLQDEDVDAALRSNYEPSHPGKPAGPG